MVPAIVFFTSEPAPYNTPFPASKGPVASPLTGFSYKSTTPVYILLNKPTGLPRISRLPKILSAPAKASL